MQTTANQVIEQTVTGLGYDLVELERSAGGLLRVTIDWPYDATAPAKLIAVEDCERVTRQLQFVLEVENVDYKRLEVASPGLDRRLRNEVELQRFVGQVVDITLKEAIGFESKGVVSGLRKKFRGTLEKADTGWQVVWSDAPKAKPGARISPKREVVYHALGFEWGELREARLAPMVDFKGRAAQ